MKVVLITVLFVFVSLRTVVAQTDTEKLVKKEERIAKRFIHPKSKYLTFSSGWGFTSTIMDDPNDFMTEGIYMSNNSFVPTIAYEHGLKNNFFAEVGYAFIRQGFGFGRTSGDRATGSYSSNYSNHDIRMGVGYRVIGKNNINFFNVHAGFFMGFANSGFINMPDALGTFSKTDFDDVSVYSYDLIFKERNRLAFGPYLGISKEVRLTQEIRFFAKYVQAFGLRTIMGGDMFLMSDDIDFVTEPATFRVTGGGGFITLGVKIAMFGYD